MATIDRENIKALFARMTSAEAADKYADLAAAAYLRISGLAGAAPLDGRQAAACEYAAAADAAYRYFCEEAVREELYMSELGSVRRDTPSDRRTKAARALRDGAFAGLAGIIRDEDFVFALTDEAAEGGAAE